MTNDNETDTLLAIADEAVADLFETSDEELRQELLEDGQDPDVVVDQTRSIVQAAVDRHLRKKQLEAGQPAPRNERRHPVCHSCNRINFDARYWTNKTEYGAVFNCSYCGMVQRPHRWIRITQDINE